MRLNSWLASLYRTMTSPNIRVGRRKRTPLTAVSQIVESLEARQLLSAQAITVTTLSDTETAGKITLRDAIATANADAAGDTISFANSLFASNQPMTIGLTQGPLQISSSMSITGPGANKLTVSGNHLSQVFIVNDGITSTDQVAISGLTIANGLANSAYIIEGSGGGISNTEHLTLSNDVFTGNVSELQGGAVYNLGTLTCTNDTFASNSAVYGGGVYNLGAFSSSSNTYYSNLATDGGGFDNAGNMTSSGDTVSNNVAYNGGYGGGIANLRNLTITNDTIADNIAQSNLHGFGGGVANLSRLVSTNVTIVGNYGGGVYNRYQWSSMDTIVAGNFNIGGSSAPLDVVNGNSTSIITAFSTLVGDATSAGGSLHGIVNGVNGNVVGVDPKTVYASYYNTNPLIPLLTNNGGPTNTVALIPGSPALGAAAPIDSIGAGGLDSASTTLNVATGTFLAVGDALLIDSEIVIVTATTTSPTSFIISRGADGTTAAAHATGAAIKLAFDGRGFLRGVTNNLGAFDLQVNPSFSAPASTYVYENSPFTYATNAIVIVDAEDTGNPDTLSLSVVRGTLTLGSTTGLTFLSGANGTGSFKVSGTLTNLNAALNGMVYTPPVNYLGPDTLNLQYHDVSTNLSGSKTIAISVFSVAPAITAPATVTVNQGNVFSFTASNSIFVSDTGGTIEQMTLSVNHGLLHLGSTAGLVVSGNGTATINVSGDVALLKSSLATLTYTPAPNYYGSDTLSLTDEDTGNLLMATKSVAITVKPLAPTIHSPGAAAVSMNGTLPFTVGNAISVTDPSGTAEQMTLSVLHGTLNFGTTVGLIITGNGTGAVMVRGSLSAINTALATLTYRPKMGYVGADTLSLSDADTTDGATTAAHVAITVM